MQRGKFIKLAFSVLSVYGLRFGVGVFALSIRVHGAFDGAFIEPETI